MDIQTKTTPKDVFLNLVMFGALYVSVVSFLNLLFQLINAGFPDLLSGDFPNIHIRSAVAALFVSWPVFILAAWFTEKDIVRDASRKSVWPRKWLTYVTLFLAAVTIMVDLYMLVRAFLEGELTTRFVLKVLCVLLVAAVVFGFYLWETRRTNLARRETQWSAIAASVVVVAGIVIGFFVAGSPVAERTRRFDEQRVWNLQAISSEIVGYWDRKGKLPVKLEDLKNELTGFIPPTDPTTALSYEYAVKGPLTFEVCATFETATLSKKSPKPAPRGYETYGYSGYSVFETQWNWEHGKGRTCFERTIDPDFFKDRGGVDKPL